MFRTSMKESTNNVVQIHEIQYGCFLELLKYLYFDCSQLDPGIFFKNIQFCCKKIDIVMDLLPVALQYNLTTLSTICEKMLADAGRISENNTHS